jgi:nicotinate-nucleotide adenylyltransferase
MEARLSLKRAALSAQRIGLFGGSFDPVHNAHVALAEVAMAQLQLDSVRWIPAGNPWQKPNQLAAAEHRAAMVTLAIAHEPRFVLDRCELHRDGPSYTLDTVRELQTTRPAAQFFLIIGQDQYTSFHTWRGWQDLLQRVTLAVAGRPGAPSEVNADVLNAGHQPVALPMTGISSTEIRSRIANGQDIADLVPAPVASYIARHSLYRGNQTQVLNNLGS